ncbi:hypothetical protein Fmac_024081 [Flemingia macrophylla]|uniref:GST C-terminal domain-containing protein n=1 Tax=Flemingia macrophylla TaxID=520843 RepID=A0ABD1LNV9_9FABA
MRNWAGEEREKNVEKVWEHLMVVEKQCLGDQKKFFGGDTINMVDLAFGSIVKFLLVVEDILEVKVLKDEKFPHLHSWYNNFKEGSDGISYGTDSSNGPSAKEFSNNRTQTSPETDGVKCTLYNYV